MSEVTTAESAVARHRAVFHDLVVDGIDPLTDEAVAVTFRIPPELADEYAFEPGQHLTIRATIGGEDVRQSYSICQSRAASTTTRRVAVARVPEGRMSTWLNDDVRVGDVLDVMTPLGEIGRAHV